MLLFIILPFHLFIAVFVRVLALLLFFLVLLHGSGASSVGIIIAHNIAVVTDHRARAVPGFVDADALKRANVKIRFPVNATNGLELAVARAVVVEDGLARLLGFGLDQKDRIARRGAFVPVSAAVAATDWLGTKSGAVVKASI